ncbi:MAG: hypothetical protein JWP66_217 [Naasia sp.]|nr:hypothetical protein [Naasia sp.]
MRSPSHSFLSRASRADRARGQQRVDADARARKPVTQALRGARGRATPAPPAGRTRPPGRVRRSRRPAARAAGAGRGRARARQAPRFASGQVSRSASCRRTAACRSRRAGPGSRRSSSSSSRLWARYASRASAERPSLRRARSCRQAPRSHSGSAARSRSASTTVSANRPEPSSPVTRCSRVTLRRSSSRRASCCTHCKSGRPRVARRVPGRAPPAQRPPRPAAGGTDTRRDRLDAPSACGTTGRASRTPPGRPARA